MKSRFKLIPALMGACILLAAACLALGVGAAIYQPLLLLLAVAAVAAAGLFLLLGGRGMRARIAGILSSGEPDNGEMICTLKNMGMPAALLQDETVVWGNGSFSALMRENQTGAPENIHALFPDYSTEKAAAPEGQCLEQGERKYTVYAAPAQSGYSLLFLTEDTQLKEMSVRYRESRPTCILYQVDGYQELFDAMKESGRAKANEAIQKTLEAELQKTNGFLQRIDRDLYLALIEEQHLKRMEDGKFSVLDRIRKLQSTGQFTLSIGVGTGQTFEECRRNARESLNMAVRRGGDQAAVRHKDGFVFYGGISRSVEKQSKVKNRILAAGLVDQIQKSDSVVIMGHRLSDMDSVGAAVGVMRIAQICKIPAVIAVNAKATFAGTLLEQMENSGFADYFMEPKKVLPSITQDTLLIVVDTYRESIVESAELLRASQRVAVIDHHRLPVDCIQDPVLVCHEPSASSASELVTELLQYVDTPEGMELLPEEAEALMAGIFLDTRSFALQCGVRTFEAAAYLRSKGAEMQRVKRLFNVSPAEYAARAKLVANAHFHRGCAIAFTAELEPELSVAAPQAANDLLSIGDVKASFVAVEQKGNVSISARSLGEMNVQVVMEALGGGGHHAMAGTQLKGCTAEQAEQRLIQEIDRYFENADRQIGTGKPE